MRPGPFLALPLALACWWGSDRAVYDPAGPIVATPIPLDRDAPGPIRVGALRFVAGWVLRSPNVAFGGLSTMVVDDHGHFLAVGDTGNAFRFHLRPDGKIDDVLIRDLPGTTLRKSMSDTESMAIDPRSGTVWVGYEVRNGVRRFDPALTRIETGRAPRAMARWPTGTGPESMERLKDGRFVILSEDARVPGSDRGKRAILFSGDPTLASTRVTRFIYRAPAAGFWPTDMRQLPDGRLLVLHRKLSIRDGFSASLAVFDPRAIHAGAVITGQEIAHLHQPLAIDNMEALAISREVGRTIVWIASDDNFLWLQSTLLLKFALADQRS